MPFYMFIEDIFSNKRKLIITVVLLSKDEDLKFGILLRTFIQLTKQFSESRVL